MQPRVAIYGGSFDPPHISHVLAVVYALKVGGFSEVLMVPVFEHAFQKELSPFEQRVRMCELALSGIASTSVSTIERDLSTPSLTLRTLERLQADHPDWALGLLVGADVLGAVAKWHAFERVSALAPPFIVARPGFSHPDASEALLPDISSTRVRAALVRRNPEDLRFLRGAVAASVLDYIEAEGMYQARIV